MHAPVPILEVEVTLQNNSPGKLRVEPGMFALHSRQTGRVSPLTLNEAKAQVSVRPGRRCGSLRSRWRPGFGLGLSGRLTPRKGGQDHH